MRNIVWMLCLVPLSGCFHHAAKEDASPGNAQPSIDLVDAMRQVGEGLAEMRNAQEGVKTGLIADTATVTFNISADRTNSGKLKVNLAAPAISEGIGVGGEAESKHESKRSNAVTVTFKNILLIPKDTVGHALVTASDKAGENRLTGFIDKIGMNTFSASIEASPVDR